MHLCSRIHAHGCTKMFCLFASYVQYVMRLFLLDTLVCSVDLCFPLTSKEVSDRLTKNDWLLVQKQHFSTFSSNLDMIHEDRILTEAPMEENYPKVHWFSFWRLKKKENVRYEEVAQQLLSVNVSKAFHVLKLH